MNSSLIIKNRFDKKKTPFNAQIKKNKLKTFSVLKKTETIKNKYNNEIKITAQRNVLVYAQLLVLAQENGIDLDKLFYPLGPVPWPLATNSESELISTYQFSCVFIKSLSLFTLCIIHCSRLQLILMIIL